MGLAAISSSYETVFVASLSYFIFLFIFHKAHRAGVALLAIHFLYLPYPVQGYERAGGQLSMAEKQLFNLDETLKTTKA